MTGALALGGAISGKGLGLSHAAEVQGPGLVAAGDRDLIPSGKNPYQNITGQGVDSDRGQWDKIFDTRTYVFGKEPAPFLRDSVERLPRGRALDIAMGEGRNAVFLAKKGFQVDGVDISGVAIRKAKLLAREHGVSITAIIADLNDYVIKPEGYDLIVNINFLLRTLVPQIKKGLKRGGYVIFENQTVDQLEIQKDKPIPREWLLKKGELRELFKDFQIVLYKETNDGTNAVASLIAKKP